MKRKRVIENDVEFRKFYEWQHMVSRNVLGADDGRTDLFYNPPNNLESFLEGLGIMACGQGRK